MKNPASGISMPYLIQQIARQMDWIDPKLLVPGNGPGRSPENAMQFNDFQKKQNGMNPNQQAIQMQEAS